LFANLAKVNLHTIFKITSILLVLFAAGLMAHGVHEFQEAGALPLLTEQAWDLNPPENADGSLPALHEKRLDRRIAKGLFGYNGNPSWLEVLSYLGLSRVNGYRVQAFGKR